MTTGHDERPRLATAAERLTNLARAFPTLRGADGLAPFDALRLDEWACRNASQGGRHAAAFVLGIYNSSASWGVGKFDPFGAVGCWDRWHREAFASWARDPWLA